MQDNTYNQPNPSNPNPERKDSRMLIYGVLAALLLGTWGYLIYDKNKSGKDMDTLTSQNTLVTSERDQVRELYNLSLSRLDSMMGVNQNLNDSLSSSSGEIANLRSEIRRILSDNKATSADLARARTMIKQLNSRIETLAADVERLEGENEQLLVDNERITTEKQTLATDLEVVRTERTNIQKTLDETTDVGSTLNASNIAIAAINEKNSGKEKSTTTARRADKLRISFDLDPNRLAKSGEKEIYVAVTAPDGTAISTSNFLTTREEGEKPVAAKITVPYETGRRTPVSFDWRSDNGFQTGDYKIEIYHNGFKIGEGVRNLKKGGLFS